MKIAIKFKQLKVELIKEAIHFIDNYYLVLSSAGNIELLGFVSIKESIFNNRNNSIIEFWTGLQNLIKEYNFDSANKTAMPFLSKKANSANHLLHQVLHDYNQEVILIEQKLKKPFFSLVNKLVLKIDLLNNPLLSFEN